MTEPGAITTAKMTYFKGSSRRFIPAAMALLFSLLLLSGMPLHAEKNLKNIPNPAVYSQFRPDYAGMADNFLTGMCDGSPELLGKYLDIRDELEGRGKLRLLGNFIKTKNLGAALREGLLSEAEDMIEKVPVLGQMYAMGKLGQQLGDWATEHYGKGRFDSLYAAAQHGLDKGDWQQGFNSGFVQALITQGTKGGNIYTWLNKHSGKSRSREENEKLIWKMLKAKHDFNMLADKYGLQGTERTYEALQKKVGKDIQVKAVASEMVEQDRLDNLRLKLALRTKKEKEALEKEKKFRKENNKFYCDIWLGKAVDPRGDVTIDQRPSDEDVEYNCGKKPKPINKDDALANTDTPPGPAAQADKGNAELVTFKPKETKINVDAPLALSIIRNVIGSQTFCIISVVNNSNRPLPSLSLSVKESGPYSSGGVGKGQKNRGSAVLQPGQIRSFTSFVSGDAPGVTGTFSAAGKALGGFTCFSAHTTRSIANDKKEGQPEAQIETYVWLAFGMPQPVVHADISADGLYRGSGTDDDTFGEKTRSFIEFSIRGKKVSGKLRTERISFNPGYRGDDFLPSTKSHKSTYVTAGKITGVYDARTGAIQGGWSGRTQHVEMEGGVVTQRSSSQLGGCFAGIIQKSVVKGKWDAFRASRAETPCLSQPSVITGLASMNVTSWSARKNGK